MYSLNPLMRNVLITADEVIFHAPTKHTLDPRTIEQSIIIAEERFIRPEIDFDMYYDMADTKNVAVTSLNKAAMQNLIGGKVTLKEGDIINAYEFLSAPYKNLWKQHLWKLVAECVMLVSYPEAYIQFGSAGIMHTMAPAGPMTTASEVAPELRSVKWMMDVKQNYRIAPLIEAMHSYICKYKTNYALYDSTGCPCDDLGPSKRTDIITSIYDDNEDTSCRCARTGWI